MVTVPLGVLKGRSPETAIVFNPPLPQKKREAIDRLGFGVENKAFLEFETRFWPNVPYFQSTDPRFRFINLDNFGVAGVVAAHMNPPFSQGYNGLTDDEVIKEICTALARMFCQPLTSVVPIRSHVTRWNSDAFAGCGSYSFIRVGATQDDVTALRESVGPLYFAGEACSETDMQCIHGAVGTGEDAAEAITVALSQ